MNKILLFTFLFFSFHSLSAQEKTENPFPSARVSAGPWLQAVTDSEFTVVWTTTVDAVVWVEVAPDDGTPFYAETRKKYYESHYGRRPIGKLHRVKISGLTEGTKYRYRIYQQALLSDEGNKRVILGEAFGTDILKNKPYSVTLLSPKKESARFSVFSDIHEQDSLFNVLASPMAKLNNDFVVFNGDMLTQIESRKQIEDGYLRTASKLFASNTPLYALRGNHEHRGSASYDFMSFFPSNNGLPYYTVQHGSTFFLFLECGEDKPDSDIRYYGLSLTDEMRAEQAEWLKKVVETDEFKTAEHRIVFLHMPPISNKWHGAQELNRLLVPILNKANIDIMFSGHEHKLRYIEKDAQGNNFPILINSNKQRVDVVTDKKKGISVNVVDQNQNMVKTLQLK